MEYIATETKQDQLAILRRLGGAPVRSGFIGSARYEQTSLSLQAEARTKNCNNVLRRLGAAPLHRRCSDGLSWKQVIFATKEGNFSAKIDAHSIPSGKDREELIELIQSLGGGGGIADYEEYGAISGNLRSVARSMHLATWQIGILCHQRPVTQDPIFVVKDSIAPIPERIPEGFSFNYHLNYTKEQKK